MKFKVLISVDSFDSYRNGICFTLKNVLLLLLLVCRECPTVFGRGFFPNVICIMDINQRFVPHAMCKDA